MKYVKRTVAIILILAIITLLIISHCWVALIVISLIIFVIIGFFWMLSGIGGNTPDFYGEEYEKDKKDGTYNCRKMYLCKPTIYCNKKLIEKYSGVTLPDYEVTECKQSAGNMRGEFNGHAIITFAEPISNNIINQINNLSKEFSDKWEYINDTVYVCNMGKDNTWWQLVITVGSNNAEINYGAW